MKVLLEWKVLILCSSVCLTTKLKFLRNAMQFPHPPSRVLRTIGILSCILKRSMFQKKMILKHIKAQYRPLCFSTAGTPYRRVPVICRVNYIILFFIYSLFINKNQMLWCASTSVKFCWAQKGHSLNLLGFSKFPFMNGNWKCSNQPLRIHLQTSPENLSVGPTYDI